jgi:hypothetical protein
MKNFLMSDNISRKRKWQILRELGEQFDASPASEKAFEANLTDGNAFFFNRGDGTFKEIAWATDTHFAQWAWAADFVDYDNDGDQDIFVVNGFHTGEKSEDT